MRKFSHISEKSYAGGFETFYIFITITQSCSLAHSQQWVWVPVSHRIPWPSCGTCPLVWMPQLLLLDWLRYTRASQNDSMATNISQGKHCCPLWLLADRKIFSYSRHVFILHYVPEAYQSNIPQRRKLKYFYGGFFFFFPGETVNLNF